MSLARSSKRILITGREVGPIAQLIKNYGTKKRKISIGAVDVLGNVETRFFSDWKFSIEKQSPSESIYRYKHRPIIDLLYELTLIMVEDIEFDLLIPLIPFQSKPEYLEQLSKEVEVLIPNHHLINKIKIAYDFLSTIHVKIPELIPTPIRLRELYDATQINGSSFFVSKKGNFLFHSKKDMEKVSNMDVYGFYFPFSTIHCANFVKSHQTMNFIGIQTLSPPFGHNFFPNNLEKNAFFPFSPPKNFSHQVIQSFLTRIINILDLKGFITLYFGFSDEKIIPLSCNILPDENIDLWDLRCTEPIISFFLSSLNDNKEFHPSSIYAFKVPFYSPRSIGVPVLPKNGITQRNLTNVISHPSYPICSILNDSPSKDELKNQFNLRKSQISYILGFNN